MRNTRIRIARRHLPLEQCWARSRNCCDILLPVTTWRRLAIPAVVVGGSLAATFALAIRATGGWGGPRGWSTTSVYDHAAFVLVVACALGGLLLTSTEVQFRLAGGGMAAVAGVGLAGTGVTAHRRWYTSGGFNISAKNLDDLRLMAVVLAVAGALAAAAGLVTLWPVLLPRLGPVAVALSLVAVVGVPLVMGHDPGSALLTSTGAHTLMYGLPWSLAVLIVATTEGALNRAVIGVAVLHLTVVAVDKYPMISAPHRTLGVAFGVALLAFAWLCSRPNSVGRWNRAALRSAHVTSAQ